MSGTGVQSAMRRRTRPPEEIRRPSSSINSTSNVERNVERNLQQINNQRVVNPGQILFAHQQKIIEIEKKLLNLDPSSVNNNDDMVKILKQDLENHFDKKINILTNNLNFLLNSLNEEKSKVKILEGIVSDLVNKNKELEETISKKVTGAEVDECIKKQIEQMEQIKIKHTNTDEISEEVIHDNEDVENTITSSGTIGTLESVSINDEQEENKETYTEYSSPDNNNRLDTTITTENDKNTISDLSLEGIDLSQLVINSENNENNVTQEITEITEK